MRIDLPSIPEESFNLDYKPSFYMLSSGNKNLENYVVAILAKHGRVSANKMHKIINTNNIPCTIQGIYRVLRKLQKEGVIVKEKQAFSLRISWLLELSELVDEMEETYLRQDYTKQLLPDYGDRHIWRFTNLFKMNDFRAQLLLSIAKHSNKDVALHYLPHTWHVLIQRQKELKFTETFSQEFRKSFTMIGSRSYLDKYALSIMKDHCHNGEFYLSAEDEYIEKNRALYIDVVDDYVLVTKLGKVIDGRITQLYDNTPEGADVDSVDILPICTNKVKIKMTLKKDSKKAGIYRRRFQKVFGPLYR